MKYTGKALMLALSGAMLCASLVGCVGGNGNTEETTASGTTEQATAEQATTAPTTDSGIVDEVVGDVSEALTTQTETTGSTGSDMGRMRPGMRGRDGK